MLFSHDAWGWRQGIQAAQGEPGLPCQVKLSQHPIPWLLTSGLSEWNNNNTFGPTWSSIITQWQVYVKGKYMFSSSGVLFLKPLKALSGLCWMVVCTEQWVEGS